MTRPSLIPSLAAYLFAAFAFPQLGHTETQPGDQPSPLLRPADTVAMVGGTFVERMQRNGHIEAELQSRRPDWKLRVRNLGWSGDVVQGTARRLFDKTDVGYQRLISDVQLAEPSVVIVAYGSTEASEGSLAVNDFAAGLRKLTSDLQSILGSKGTRVILVKPIAMPGYRVAEYPANLERIAGEIDTVARELQVPVLDAGWRPSPQHVESSGVSLNQLGYRELADKLADSLVGVGETGQHSDELLGRISKKNDLFFHRYRPQNQTYLTLFRKHEQGNNAVELDQFAPLIEEADQAIWAAAVKPKQ